MTHDARRKAFSEIADLRKRVSTEADVANARKIVTSAFAALSTLVFLRNIPVHVPILLALLLSSFVGYGLCRWLYDRWVKPTSWREQLDQALSDYEPLDVAAFKALQEDTAETGRLRYKAFARWQESEQIALKGDSGITADRWNFVRQH